MRTLAELLEPVEAETPYGGRVTTFEILGVAWLELGARRSRERGEDEVSRSVEALEAGVRVDPRLTEGRVLRFGGGDWTIRRIDGDPGRPGRATLSLERGR
ncbi:MAG: phage head-tail adapter protein [Brevundimonas sp.]|nr:phage head-tail adapter protein [Brevundimonas sp.]